MNVLICIINQLKLRAIVQILKRRYETMLNSYFWTYKIDDITTQMVEDFKINLKN